MRRRVLSQLTVSLRALGLRSTDLDLTEAKAARVFWEISSLTAVEKLCKEYGLKQVLAQWAKGKRQPRRWWEDDEGDDDNDNEQRPDPRPPSLVRT